MQLEALKKLVVETLEEMKGIDVTVIDVRGKTCVTDYMIVVTGTSAVHVKSLAETVSIAVKEAGDVPLGIEGAQEGEWALLDLNGVVLHAMQAKVRDFYQLERLWAVDTPNEEWRSDKA
jgi:ribosome-associated protein